VLIMSLVKRFVSIESESVLAARPSIREAARRKPVLIAELGYL
jgi:hypothetical protein